MVNVLTLLGEVEPSSNEVCELLMTPPDPPGSLSPSRHHLVAGLRPLGLFVLAGCS